MVYQQINYCLGSPTAKSYFSPGKPFSPLSMKEQDNYLKSTVVKLRLPKKDRNIRQRTKLIFLKLKTRKCGDILCISFDGRIKIVKKQWSLVVKKQATLQSKVLTTFRLEFSNFSKWYSYLWKWTCLQLSYFFTKNLKMWNWELSISSKTGKFKPWKTHRMVTSALPTTKLKAFKVSCPPSRTQ